MFKLRTGILIIRKYNIHKNVVLKLSKYSQKKHCLCNFIVQTLE